MRFDQKKQAELKLKIGYSGFDKIESIFFTWPSSENSNQSHLTGQQTTIFVLPKKVNV